MLEDALYQNYPNPFNPQTRITQVSGEHAGGVELAIYDVLGRRIRTLVVTEQGLGRHEAVWDDRDEGRMPVGSGVYVYRLRAGDFRVTRRMLLVR